MKTKPGGVLSMLIAGKGEPPGETKESPGGDAKMRAAEDALDAFKSGDAGALNDALSRHYRACASEGSGGDDDNEEEEAYEV